MSQPVHLDARFETALGREVRERRSFARGHAAYTFAAQLEEDEGEAQLWLDEMERRGRAYFSNSAEITGTFWALAYREGANQMDYEWVIYYLSGRPEYVAFREGWLGRELGDERERDSYEWGRREGEGREDYELAFTEEPRLDVF